MRDKTHDLPTGGCAWVWVAFDPATQLIPALQLSPRTQQMAPALLHAVTLVLAPGCLPVLTCDGLDLYFYVTLAPVPSGDSAGVTAHPSAALRTSFGQWITDGASGKLRWHVALDLLYGQVKKSYRRRRLAQSLPE